MAFLFDTTIQPDWIDYNGHMRDSYYGLVYSLAVDALQDEVGFDAAYRADTGCTIYLLEAHTVFLREVKQGAHVQVRSAVIGVDARRFHLYMEMLEGDTLLSVGEFMEAHVARHPAPRVVAMPEAIRDRLSAACLTPDAAANLPHRARAMGFDTR